VVMASKLDLSSVGKADDCSSIE